MIDEEIIAILYDANITSFRNIEEIYEGSEASMSELIATLSFNLVGVVRVQLCTPAQKSSDL